MSKLATEATEVINTLANGDKKTFIWSLVMMSCICPSTLYYYCIFNKEFMELDFAKVLLVTVSIGISSFLIFIVSSIAAYLLTTKCVDDNIVKNYDDPYKHLLLIPALVNIVFYACILFTDVIKLNDASKITIVDKFAITGIFAIISGVVQVIVTVIILHTIARIKRTKQIKKVKIKKWIIYRISE